MEYLRTREQKLRDTNESTNERVKWFAFSIMATLVGLGAWQVVYLRAYFRSVHRNSKKMTLKALILIRKTDPSISSRYTISLFFYT